MDETRYCASLNHAGTVANGIDVRAPFEVHQRSSRFGMNTKTSGIGHGLKNFPCVEGSRVLPTQARADQVNRKRDSGLSPA